MIWFGGYKSINVINAINANWLSLYLFILQFYNIEVIILAVIVFVIGNNQMDRERLRRQLFLLFKELKESKG